ncbi:MAG: SDR family oxidoreductase [Acidobacteriaceae bacterium]|nr:SDR family oxidoreductase [Acidobacteriaceae bacterium]
MFPEPVALTPEQIRVGLRASFDRHIAERDILEFARSSGDANPLHVDAAYAATIGYQRPIVHGAFQIGLASALIGTQLPGRDVLLISLQARFISPLYYPNDVQVVGEVASWNRSARRGSIRARVIEKSSKITTAEFHLGFVLRDAGGETPSNESCARASPSVSDRPVILITGASGGIGSELVSRLSNLFRVLALVRDRAKVEALLNVNCNAQIVESDLETANWQCEVDAALSGSSLYGIVHAAWPGCPQGSLLELTEQDIEGQILFGGSRTVALAQYLLSHSGESGGRFIALGSVAAAKKPAIQIASYSLGKLVLEQTVLLLAPELARKQITANVVSLSFIPVGMNRHRNQRVRLREAAMVPTGRLCEPRDVSAAVEFLLSPEASFVSGQVLGLYGGML